MEATSRASLRARGDYVRREISDGFTAMTPGNCNAGHRKRLRARFLKSALEGFHDYEILEILLTFAIPRRDVKPVAKELVRVFKSLKGVFEAPPEELRAVRGIGPNAAMFISLFKAAAAAYLEDDLACKRPISSPGDVMNFLGLDPAIRESEQFLAIYLNSRNEVLGLEILHEGPIDKLSVTPRKVIEKAFDHNARSVIFVHNTQIEKPSFTSSEKEITKGLESAAAAVDIIVHDHLLIGKGAHFSARESGWLKGR